MSDEKQKIYTNPIDDDAFLFGDTIKIDYSLVPHFVKTNGTKNRNFNNTVSKDINKKNNKSFAQTFQAQEKKSPIHFKH